MPNVIAVFALVVVLVAVLASVGGVFLMVLPRLADIRVLLQAISASQDRETEMWETITARIAASRPPRTGRPEAT